MDRKKIIYIGLILIMTVLISVMCFSYAFFTNKSEQHGKLNIVAGTLNYKIESSSLVNNAITVAANQSATIEIKITSLNNIESKYQLYYISNNEDVEVGYGSNNDLPTGTISPALSKNIQVTVDNKSTSSATVTFGVQGGFINNTLVLETGNSITNAIDGSSGEVQYVWNFDFDPDNDGLGQEQVYTVPNTGDYKLEVWGAQGATYDSTSSYGGYGGYSVGVVSLEKGQQLYLNVGGQGNLATLQNGVDISVPGGYNGGGNLRLHYNSDGTIRVGGSGGGATHIALTSGLLSSLESYKGTLSDTNDYYISDTILIVAGGGGGSAALVQKSTTHKKGGSGGGYKGTNTDCTGESGATQIDGGYCKGYEHVAGGFGLGSSSPLTGNSLGGSGGGGFYGGGLPGANTKAGAGGSGYIASSKLVSSNGVTKHMTCFNCQTSPESSTETYTISNTCHNSEPTENCAKEGNGYIRITYLENFR